MAKPLIIQWGWLLSHTVRRSTAKNRENRIETALNRVIAQFSVRRLRIPTAFYLSVYRHTAGFF
jgi:hypothetical protein